MIENIKMIYDRERLVLAKRRVYVILYGIIMVLLTFFTLIALNRVVTLAQNEGIFNYFDILNLYERLLDILYAITLFASVFFSLYSFNDDLNNNSLRHILSTDIEAKDVIIAKFISSLLSAIELSIALFPIIMLSLFYGGISFVRLFFIILLLFLASAFLTSFSLFVSSLFKEGTRNIIFTIIGSILTLAFFIVFRNIIVEEMLIYFVVVGALIIGTIFLLFASIRLMKP